MDRETARREAFREKLGSEESLRSLEEHMRRADEKIARLREISRIDPEMMRKPIC